MFELYGSCPLPSYPKNERTTRWRAVVDVLEGTGWEPNYYPTTIEICDSYEDAHEIAMSTHQAAPRENINPRVVEDWC